MGENKLRILWATLFASCWMSTSYWLSFGYLLMVRGKDAVVGSVAAGLTGLSLLVLSAIVLLFFLIILGIRDKKLRIYMIGYVLGVPITLPVLMVSSMCIGLVTGRFLGLYLAVLITATIAALLTVIAYRFLRVIRNQ